MAGVCSLEVYELEIEELVQWGCSGLSLMAACLKKRVSNNTAVSSTALKTLSLDTIC